MFQKKNVLFVLTVGFFVAVLSGINFAQETTEDDEEKIVPVDTTEAYIPANYQPCELVREFGMGIFRQAAQIAFSPDGKVIYVVDSAASSILAFNQQGDLIFRFGSETVEYRARPGLTTEEEMAGMVAYDEENKYKFSLIMGVETDVKGNIYVTDYCNCTAKIFTSEGKFVLKLPMQVSLQKKLPGKGAWGIAVNSRGDIYIADGANGRIEINDLNGKYKYQITKFKDREGYEASMCGPGHISINSSDELYAVDPLVCRVHRFNADGDYLGSFGYMGDGAGGFNAPVGLAIDRLNRVYVIDRGFGTIQVFSKEGKFLYALCDEKGRKPEIPFVGGINVDNDNLVYVSVNDHKGYHVKVFKYLTK